MKRLILPLLVILSIALVSANDSDIFFYQDLELRTIISGDVNIKPESTNYNIDFVIANLSWFPKDDFRQEIIKIKTTPTAKTDDNILTFRWDDPASNNMEFTLDTTMIVKNDFVKVKEKVPFPIKSFDRDLLKYVQPAEIIDITPEISEKAKELSKGEDDLYQVVFNLADWTKQNIEYDLSTLTADAAQKASWVLENRYGVCDELTSLFIAMCRSLGIPAKFISGVSYTDLEIFENNWGPHGWAEVYFPGTGWVPFDVTYRELGYLDATHIKLKEHHDSKHSSVEYLSRGRNIKLDVGKLDIDTEVLRSGTKINPLININIDIKYPEVGFGSFNLIEAKIKNRQDFYVTADLTLSRTKEIESFDPYKQSILLKPGQTSTVYWLVRVDQDLQEGYVYTFPIEIHDIRGGVAKSDFKVKRSNKVYSKLEALGGINTNPKKTPPKISIDCKTKEETVFMGDEGEINCIIINNEGESEGEICVNENCVNQILESEENVFDSTIVLPVEGLTNVVVEATVGDESTKDYVLFDVLDEANLNIIDIEYPETMKFSDKSKIAFTLTKKSSSHPRNLKIKIDHGLIKQEWKMESLEFDNIFELEFRGSSLKRKNNDFKIIIEWEDVLGNEYSKEEEFRVELVDISFFESILLWFSDLEQFFLNLKDD